MTAPAGRRPDGTSHSSLIPTAYTCGNRPSSSPKRSTRALVRLPRTPSASTVTRARMSTPGSNAALRFPSRSTPRSPVRTPTTRSPLVEDLGAGEAREEVHAGGLDLLGQPAHEAIEGDDVVAVVAERRRRDRKRDPAALGQEIDAILGDGNLDRRPRAIASPASGRPAPTGRAPPPTACGRRARATSRAPRRPAARHPPYGAAWRGGRRRRGRPDRLRRPARRRRAFRGPDHSPSAATRAGTTSNRSPTTP